MQNELKPCPFCGNEKISVDVVARQFDMLSYSVRCVIDIHCNICRTTQRTNTLKNKETDCVEEAIKSWNRRVQNETN